MSILKNGIVKIDSSKPKYLINNFSESGTLDDWNFSGTGTTTSLSNGVLTLTGTSPNIQTSSFTLTPDSVIVVEYTMAMPTTSTTKDGCYFGTTASSSTIKYTFNNTSKTWSSGTDNSSQSWNTYFINAYNTTTTSIVKTYIIGANISINDIPFAEISSSLTVGCIKYTNTSDISIYLRAAYNSGNSEMKITLSNVKLYYLNRKGINQTDNESKIGKGFLSFNDFIEY